MRRKPYVVWHQDSPGTKVTVWRFIEPQIPFSRVGEPFAYGAPATCPPSKDMTP